MRLFLDSRPLRAAALASALLATGAAPAAIPPARGLPAIVFVSRNPIAGEPGAIPGLGPHHRAAITGGKLLVRESDGRVRELLPPGAFYDVSDPSVSPDAKEVAFAAVQHPDSAWRIWRVGVDGGGLTQVTFTGRHRALPGSAARRFERYDDIDPCWISTATLVFASTRYPQRAQYADVPVTNLFIVPGHGGPPDRITAERNGAEEPAMDWATGKIVFARWWFNRWRAADTLGGITTDAERAIPRDTVNLWQAVELSREDQRVRLAAADLRTRRGSMGYQPAVLADGSIAAVYAANLGLSPRPAGTGIHVLKRTFGPESRLAGAIVSGAAGDAYGGAQGLAPPSACSPAALPDGRILFSYSPGARGDFGIYVMNADGSHLSRVIDLPGTLELDATPIVRHAGPPPVVPLARDDFSAPPDTFLFAGHKGIRYADGFLESGRSLAPVDSLWEIPRRAFAFRFRDLDVFADGPSGSPAHGAAPRMLDARIRFFALLSRPEREGGDAIVLLREAPVADNGEVNETDLPADVPMFEQLVDSHGHVLMTAHGPAHVAGSNSGVAGLTTRCVGCHLGHSTLPVPPARGATRQPTNGSRP